MSDAVMSMPVPPGKPLGKRILRALMWIVLGIVGLGMALWALLLFINRNDQPLSAETQAWLQAPVYPAQNGFSPMYAIDLDVQDPQTAGQRIATQLAKMDFGAQDSKIPALKSAEGKSLPLPKVEPVCNSDKDNCIETTLRRADQLRAQMAESAVILERYRHIIATKDPIRPIHLDFAVYNVSRNIVNLVVADAILKAEQGDLSALDTALDSLRFWLETSRNIESSLSAMMSNVQVGTHMKMLNALLDKNSELRPYISARLLPYLSDLLKQPEREMQEHLLHGELRAAYYYINMIAANQHAARNWYDLTPIQPNSTLNLLQSAYAHKLAHKDQSEPAMCKPSLDWLYNPSGRLSACNTQEALSIYNPHQKIEVLVKRLKPA